MFSHLKAAYTRDQCGLASSGLGQLWHRFACIVVFTWSWYHVEEVQFQTRPFLLVNLFGTGQENRPRANLPGPVKHKAYPYQLRTSSKRIRSSCVNTA